MSTVDGAKWCGVSTYTDITPAGQVGPTGQITGSLNITQGWHKLYRRQRNLCRAQGRNTTASERTALLATKTVRPRPLAQPPSVKDPRRRQLQPTHKGLAPTLKV